MLQLTYPGVYTQEKSSGAHTIVGASTSVAHFIGPTRTGIDNRPTRCLNYGDFERQFGGLHRTSSLSYSVLHFFANGGSEAIVTRLPVETAKAAKSVIKSTAAGASELTFSALGSGAAGNEIFIEIDRFEIGAAALTSTPDAKRFNLTVVDSVTGRVERFGDLTTAAGNARSAETVVNDVATGSRLVKVTVTPKDGPAPTATGSVYAIATTPAAGTVPADKKLLLTIATLTGDGNADAGHSVTGLEVLVLANGSALPSSPRELVTRVVAAINDTIRTDPAAAGLGGAVVQGEVVEAGAGFRLSVVRPTSAGGTVRVPDATVTIADPASPNAAKLLTMYGITAVTTQPSRYHLGQLYGGEVAARPPAGSDAGTVAGIDGAAHGQPDSGAFKDAITALENRDPFFNLLCVPDLARAKTTDPLAAHHANAADAYAEAARVCALKFAFLLVDPPPNVNDVGAAEAWKSLGMRFSSSHAGGWFPRIRVDDPLQPGSIIAHPPSGAIAGVIARTDAQVGVWQAPAGTDATLAGVYGPAVEVSDPEQGLLNPLGLNVIRQFPIYQTVAFGSRTIDGANALGSEWKYIPVRRTADYVLRTLSESLRWAVHKPNGEDLWSQLRVSVTAFMHGLYRQGAFKGTSARQAYFVACDASTTTQADIDLGAVNIVVGFSPLKPAEFVVVTLRQIVQPAV